MRFESSDIIALTYKGLSVKFSVRSLYVLTHYVVSVGHIIGFHNIHMML